MKETNSKRCSTNCLPKDMNLWERWYGCVKKISPIYIRRWRCGRLLKMGPTASCTVPTVLRPAPLVLVLLMKPKGSFQAWHQAGRFAHGHNSAPVPIQQGVRRSSLQMTEGGDSTWILQAALSKQAIIRCSSWVLDPTRPAKSLSFLLPQWGTKKTKPRLGNSRTRTHSFMHLFQFLSWTDRGQIAKASS